MRQSERNTDERTSNMDNIPIPTLTPDQLVQAAAIGRDADAIATQMIIEMLKDTPNVATFDQIPIDKRELYNTLAPLIAAELFRRRWV